MCVCVFLCSAEVFPPWAAGTQHVLVQEQPGLSDQSAHQELLPLLPLPEMSGGGHVTGRWGDSNCDGITRGRGEGQGRDSNLLGLQGGFSV